MASRKELLKNLQNYSAEEIADAVRSGKVSLYELSKESGGAFTPLLKRQVQELLKRPQVSSPASQDVPETLGQTSQEASVFMPQDTQSQNADSGHESDNSASPSNTAGGKRMFRHPFSFNGRIRRLEYCISILIYSVWSYTGEALTSGSDPSLGACLFVLITVIPMIWFLWAQNCKRCHDRGNSGWYQLIPFYCFVLLFGDGEAGSNSYGDNPKE